MIFLIIINNFEKYFLTSFNLLSIFLHLTYESIFIQVVILLTLSVRFGLTQWRWEVFHTFKIIGTKFSTSETV